MCVYSCKWIAHVVFYFQSMAYKPVDSSPDSTDVEEAGEENSESNEDEG